MFHTTRWSIVVAAGNRAAPDAQAALAALCETYWPAVYGFVRRKGHDADAAGDLTQAFFCRVLEKNTVGEADRGRGKFRSFLLSAVKFFLANEFDKATAQKRGGNRRKLSLDFDSAESRLFLEPAHDDTPERLFDRQWAITVLERAMARLREEHTAGDRLALFERLKSSITAGDDAASHAETAAALDMSEGAVKVAAHRLRKRYRELLRAEIAETVANASEIDDEIRDLFAALRR
jgi:RNA polymerase sigma-70 factor (ECF subfamily)